MRWYEIAESASAGASSAGGYSSLLPCPWVYYQDLEVPC
jgi:hypothetical protein